MTPSQLILNNFHNLLSAAIEHQDNPKLLFEKIRYAYEQFVNELEGSKLNWKEKEEDIQNLHRIIVILNDILELLKEYDLISDENVKKTIIAKEYEYKDLVEKYIPNLQLKLTLLE